MKNWKLSVATIIIIVLVGTVIYLLLNNKNDNMNSTANINQEQISEEMFPLISMSPDGVHVVFVEKNSDGSYYTLTYRNLQTDENTILDTMSTSSQYYDFTWYGSDKVYYAISGELNNGYTTFYYYDFSGVDPFAGAGIVFEDPNLVMQGEVDIAGVGEDILYIQKDNKIYSVNLKEGAGAVPVLVMNMKNI